MTIQRTRIVTQWAKHLIHLSLIAASLQVLLPVSLSWSFTFDRTVPQAVQKQMKADLEFIKSIQGSRQSQLHQDIFGSVDGKVYDRFFNDRVTAIGLHSCGDRNAVACVIPYLNPSKMWVTQNYIRFNHPQIARLMVIFHEARHTESDHDNWGHATCPSPFVGQDGQPITSIWTGAELADQPACDETPYGSYGSSLILLKNIADYCSNCTSKVKLDAGIYADDQFKRIIDTHAIEAIHNDLYDPTRAE